MKYFFLALCISASIFTQAQSINTVVPEVPKGTDNSFGPVPGYDVNKYLQQNGRYPPIAKKEHIEGKVTVQFIVNEDGHLSDFRVRKGIDPSCDSEAIRVMKTLPRWIPGKQDGKLVKVDYILYLLFKLQD